MIQSSNLEDFYFMSKLDDLLAMWAKDAEIDRTEPGKALLDIPKLHSKYLNILSSHRLLIRESEFKYNRMKKIKWEYYTGKLDDDELKKYGWEPFPFVLKSDITTYLEADEDLTKYLAQKRMNEEIVEVCQSIMKELSARTFQLKDFITWEKFIQGV
jgi:hypothetical protein